MSLEKLYNYVCGVMQRSEVYIDENDKEKMLSLLPRSQELRSGLSGAQSRNVRNVLERLPKWPKKAQELELQIISMRLAKMMEFEELPTCDKCNESVQETTSIAVGTDLYSCCQECADRIRNFIHKG